MSGLAVPSQRTWSVGDIVTAAEMNANVRDAVNFLLGKPLFVGTQASPQSCANGTVVPITFDTSVVDTYSGHSVSVNPSRYTAQVAGWYLVTGQIAWSGASAGYRSTLLTVNGGGKMNLEMPVAAATLFTVPSPAIPVQLNVGDYVELNGYQTSGASLSTYSSGAYQSMFSVMWYHS